MHIKENAKIIYIKAKLKIKDKKAAYPLLFY
jgi:hypothetical protein